MPYTVVEGRASRSGQITGEIPMTATTHELVTATLVPMEHRMTFLPEFFGAKYMIRGEGLVYVWMGKLCKEYRGGFWQFFTLSNGGFFMAPDAKMIKRSDGGSLSHWLPEGIRERVGGWRTVPQGSLLTMTVPTNGFIGEMSGEAAGIVATLFALCQLAGETEVEQHIEHYHSLRSFACDHVEREQILAAID